MHVHDSEVVFSPTDLALHLGCGHRTMLELARANGIIPKPDWANPSTALMYERGRQHEAAYVEALKSARKDIVELIGNADPADTLDAMRAGREIVVQGTLQHDRWLGRPDILRRIATPSNLGAYSYEAVDAKLSTETRAGSVLQLCLYSDLLEFAQGKTPESFHVVTPLGEERYRFADYAAYFRWVKRGLEKAIAAHASAPLDSGTYPEPTPQCDFCQWFKRCDAQRRNDDHVSFVAGATRLHRRELTGRDIDTMAKLAEMPIPLVFAPVRGSPESYEKVGRQARIQDEGRRQKKHLHALLPIEPGRGLCRLPEPNLADVFLDLEGDPFVGTGGREYLFGAITFDKGKPEYRYFWATTEVEERDAFEKIVDLIMSRWLGWTADAGMHLYHFGSYEPGALKRLACRYARRAEEVDALLRGERLVDLHRVTKESLRASVEAYSLKALEPFSNFERSLDLKEASQSLRAVSSALELGAPDAITEELRAKVEAYNRDDCLSAAALRDWLEGVRSEQLARGAAIPRAPGKAGAASEVKENLNERIEKLRAALHDGVPVEVTARSTEQNARWLMGHLLDWHIRESKAAWWEFFRLKDLEDDDLIEERKAIAGLAFVAERPLVGKEKIPAHRYRFPPQETDLRGGDKIDDRVEQIGRVEFIDRATGTVDIKKPKKRLDVHPSIVFSARPIGNVPIGEALFRLGEKLHEHGSDGRGPHRAGRDLLLRAPPRLMREALDAGPGETTLHQARRVVLALDESVLPIQGPPGTGKTHTGARMICSLVKTGRKVGVTATSHKVIQKLLEEVVKAAAEEGAVVRCLHKDDYYDDEASVRIVKDSKEAIVALGSGEAQVLGGTAWLWSEEHAAGAVDVLFVDEAGQMTLAQVLAASQAAKSLVLLGDPQQLEQPQQGTHPDGVGVSALEHLFERRQTIPEGRGLFLPQTWRLAPPLCDFTSEVFYEGRLTGKPGLERQALVNAGPFSGAGLYFMPVDHVGNRSASMEEIDTVVAIIDELLSKASWVNEKDEKQRLKPEDILVVAPYNAQVMRLAERLEGSGVAIGTVDKFQGQQAPVVIYTLASSTPEDAPRGMEFLYSPNRLNVATSRAKCACLLVASPALFEPLCATQRQMQLANAFCRYREVAQQVELPARGMSSRA